MALHPQAQQFLEDLAAQEVPEWSQMSPTEGRELFSSLTELFGESEAVDRVEDVELAGTASRIFTPSGVGPFPAVLYFHGGGWVLGDRETHDPLCRRFANRSSSVIILVDYSRAPEHKFPVALEECFRATRHVAEQGRDYNIDPGRLAVAGDSAGGNLATAVALMARDQGTPDLRLQLLIYPVLESRFDTESYRRFASDYGLTRGSMVWFWQQYLSSDQDKAHPYAAPLTAENLRGLPPAHIITAEHDVLRDEGEAYAARLREAGVATTHRRYDGTLHGFVHFAGVFDDGMRAADDVGAVLRKHFGGQ